MGRSNDSASSILHLHRSLGRMIDALCAASIAHLAANHA